MERKRCFFVIGPEGSGTYMLTEAFVSSGCFYGHEERVRDNFRLGYPDPLVIRRSLPHRGEWIDVDWFVDYHLKDEYDVQLVFIVRSFLATISSVFNRQKIADRRKLINNYYRAIAVIGKTANKYANSLLLTYEGFVMSEDYRRWKFNSMGLPEPEMEFYNGNEKYY